MFPVPRLVVLDEEAYQCIVPALAVACKSTEPAPQLEAGVVLVIDGVSNTVIVAVHVFAHPEVVVPVTV